MDSDDVVLPEYVQSLVRTLEINGTDAAVCGFYFWSRGKQEPCCGESAPGIYGCDKYMLRFLEDWSCSLLWNKIFRRESVGNIRMEEGHRVDDEFFTYQVCLNCNTVAVTDQPLYLYRLRASSAMQDMASVQEKIMLDRIAYNVVRYRHISEKMPHLEEAYFASTLDTLARYWHHSKNMLTAQKAIRTWVKQHTGRIWKLLIPLRQKLGYLKCFYLSKPAVMAEENSIQIELEAYFE